jgi:multiple sugar transport system permease protein/raffinose/stachyose/melibiose transport system permease protein
MIETAPRSGRTDRHPDEPLSRHVRRERLTATSFLIPGLLLFGLFVVFPLTDTVYQSFFSIVPAGAGAERRFVGFALYREALTEDAVFWGAMLNSTLWASWSVLVDIPLAFLLAWCLRTRVPGWRFYRTAWFAPMLLSPVLIGLLWRYILRYEGGLLNGLLRLVGLGALATDWLGNPWALLWLFLATTWHTVGYYMVLTLTALEEIPQDYLDAAVVDGASRRQQIWHIVLPILRPLLATLIIITFTAKMRVFDLVWVTTRGGPYGKTETVITWVVQRAFYYVSGQFDMGYPSAMAIIWLVIMALGILILSRIFRTRDLIQY